MKQENYDQINNDSFDEISFKFLIKCILRNKLIISSITSIFTFLAIIFAYTTTPVWLGSFNIVVKDKNKAPDDSFGNLLGANFLTQGISDDKNETEKLILKSPLVLNPVYKYVKNFYSQNGIDTDKLTFKSWVTKEVEVDFERQTQVLVIKYKNQNKELILNALNMISKEYQAYSKKDKEVSLDQTINYLEQQEEVMKKKASISLKNLNKFSIENGLGDIDGFVELNNKRTIAKSYFGQNSNNIKIEDLNKQINKNFENNSGAGQRYIKQFALLETYEAQYVDLSSKLKDNSILIKELKNKIEKIKSSLKRPNEILITFRELKSLANRDQFILEELSQKLQVLKLEKIKALNPWELISIPTIEESPIFPMKKELVIFTFFFTFLISSLIALFKENRSGIIFDSDVLQSKIISKYIDTIYLSFPSIGKELIVNQILNNKANQKGKIAVINFSSFSDRKYFENINKNFNINLELLDISQIGSFEEYAKILFLIEEGKLNNKNIIIINQISDALKNKTIGWFLIDSKTDV